ncbi:MAG: hypothetical protein RLY27_704 [Pseudomonadota bacterium]
MKRRDFLSKTAIGTAVGVLAAPAIAQALPEIRWRCASSFPKSLDTIYGGGEFISKRVAELTSGKFQIRIFALEKLCQPSEQLTPCNKEP